MNSETELDFPLLTITLHVFVAISQGQPGRKGAKGDSLELSVYMERFRVRNDSSSEEVLSHKTKSCRF